jgi:dihydropteroate synthase
MGILNVTPDSFSDGGKYLHQEKAVEHALKMVSEGADVIDIGGESTRPGAEPISVDEELARVMPVIEQLRKENEVCISIDTSKPEVMEAALLGGASIVNDVKGFQGNAFLAKAAKYDAIVCLMHMQGEPQSMQESPRYTHHVVDEINLFFKERIAVCTAFGIKPTRLILDPGFGFGKTVKHNLQIVRQFDRFHAHSLPVMLGVSRKSTIGAVLNTPVDKRLSGSLAITVFSALKGLAMIRTHDIAETNQALLMVQAIQEDA